MHCEFLVRDLGVITHETACRALSLLTLILYHRLWEKSIGNVAQTFAAEIVQSVSLKKNRAGLVEVGAASVSTQPRRSTIYQNAGSE